MKGWFKTSSIGLAVLVAIAGVLIVLEARLLNRDTAGESFYTTRDRDRIETVDRLTFFDSADAFRSGYFDHVVLAGDDPTRITLDHRPQKGFPRDGFWTTKQVETDFPFTEFLPSWNLIAPENTGVLFQVRTRDQTTGVWSPWLRMGSWGRVDDRRSVSRSDFSHVDEDTLKLDRPANAYQFRAWLQSFGFELHETPSIRRIAITYSGPISDDSVWAKRSHPDPGPPSRWARDLPIPYRPQGDNEDAVTGMTCSPTSVSMVLHFWGTNRSTMENALAIWDDRNQIFGNWSNAVQRCGELGMDAWLQRFHNWDEVKEMIANGQPVIASIMYEPGSFDDAPIFKFTEGHLIVIRGFTPDGMVIVNDPGKRDKGNGVLYPPRGLGHAWFGHGGVGYVIRPPATPLPANLVKVLPTTLPTKLTKPTTNRVATR